jgi:cyclic-di-GMP phosphodiesterase TipF (flagellum assembly factor)
MARRMDDRIGNLRRAGAEPGRHGAAATTEAILIAAVRDALTAGRVDLHLQPVVSLPQRRTYYYESFSRLRDADGGVIMPAEWLRIAEHSGLVAEIDNLLLFRCVQIVRRLAQKERKVGVFCNISAASLADDEFFPQFLDFVRQHSDLAGSLIFEIGQQSFRDRGLNAARNMARLADFGFRFSIDKITDLDLDLADLRRGGVKFIKAPGELLISTLRAGEPLGLSAAPEIRAEDFTSLLAKYGIELIAEKIEDEATVVEILELEVALAQGHLFGAPKPLKDGILAEADAARDRAGGRRAIG